MKYCRKCHLAVNTENGFCPLCSSELVSSRIGCCESKAGMNSTCDTGSSSNPGTTENKENICNTNAEECTAGGIDPAEAAVYPQPDGGRKYNLVSRLFLFLSVATVSTCLLVNILYYSGVLWSLVVLGGIQFLWAAVAYPLMVRKNIGQMITVDAVSACILFVIIEATTRTQGWSLDYVIPFLFISATTVITFIIMIRRMKWREYSFYQFILIVLGLLPLISVISGLAKTTWPSVFSALYSFLTFIGMIIFADKKYKNELIKRFHF